MTTAPLILALDRNPRNMELLAHHLERQGYMIQTGTSLEEFDRLLNQNRSFALALIDIAGFDRSIWTRCDRLREEHIPFLVLSREQHARLQGESLAHGARGVMIKPLAIQELLGILRSLLKEPGCTGYSS